jgi:hypothetical protein
MANPRVVHSLIDSLFRRSTLLNPALFPRLFPQKHSPSSLPSQIAAMPPWLSAYALANNLIRACCFSYAN